MDQPRLMGPKQLLMTAAYGLVRLASGLTGIRERSVQALVFTPAGALVLVQHSYVTGWGFPGGGIKRGEAPEAAIVRELREEIGLVRSTRISPLPPWMAISEGGLFLVEGAEYRFRPSLEIDSVGEFDLQQLPTRRPSDQQRVLAAWLATRQDAPRLES